jgi:hypothetical protein
MRQLFLTALTAALLLAATGRAIADDDAKAIITKAIAAHGGKDNLDKFKGTKTSAKGTIDIMGNEVEFTVESMSMFPDKRKSTIKLEIMGMAATIEQVTNGDKFKMTVNGQDFPISDTQKKDAKTELLMAKAQRLTPLLSDASIELKALGESKVKDKPVLGVAVNSKGFNEIKVYFDKTTHLLTKAEFMTHDQGGAEVKREVTVREYKDVQGVKISSKTTVTNDGKKLLESTTTDVKLLEKIDDKEFSE